MTDTIRPLIAGNWKMNGLKASATEFEAMLAAAPDIAAKADLLVCPPATLIAAFAERARGSKTLAVGAQDCHAKVSGAHTGDISAEMLADAGASAIIVGHSERRADQRRDDHEVNDDDDSLHLYLPSQARHMNRGVRLRIGLAGFEVAAVLHDRTGHCHPRTPRR